ncbi:WW domain-binding protein 4 [Echinococcus granulosus]|uniref:WW domain-binding protein n=1 Tax=Echinococcus granulosus TaxID=6210 RepID=U6JHE1_ECHGR|nr:WW domain-binding protein [Echinococcus granulosus]EUB56729.1 WW domain-binding protein [Echinococcus granulosus]KAH9285546.1 WW domain-binding protein 4 [Echinococcus granulosus]CDS22772.1 ww domain binding protein 4 [Echinococcus granulosus]
MADYWKSNPKKYCDICKCWIQDNSISINNHESGQRHIGNVQKKLNELQRNATASSKGKMREKISLINDMAFVGMMKDIERDPSLAKRYGVDLSDDQFGTMKEKLKKIQEAKQSKVHKSEKKKSAPPIASVPVVSKPITYEWKEVKTTDGRMYYWNKKTGVTQWERPKTSIQPANDSECVSQEKKRLDQFLFNRLVELSESGVSEASTAVCQAFGASPDESQSPLPPPDVTRIVTTECSIPQDKPVTMVPSNKKRPRINLLGEWQPVIPEEPAENASMYSVPEELEPVKPESDIKLRITSFASKTFKGDEAKLQEITEKAELLSHLSQVNEADISSHYRLKFEEKQAPVSSTAKRAVHKIEFRPKSDPEIKPEPCVTPMPPIPFKRKANVSRNLRRRNNDD